MVIYCLRAHLVPLDESDFCPKAQCSKMRGETTVHIFKPFPNLKA